jgi:8-oxo-dGTP pyrophosphatase MutT (NUDIX family)
MSYLDRIAACHQWEPSRYRPFAIDDTRHGWADDALSERLCGYPDVFDVGNAVVALSPSLKTPADRSAAMAAVLADLRDSGDLPYWRNELYPVIRRWGETPAMLMERGAVPRFGVRAFGIHLNGLVRKDDGIHVWIGRRSLKKDVAPGKFDNIVAGGQPHDLSPRDNLVKECGEEAGMPADLAAQAKAVGALFYVCEQPDGLRDDVAFCFDLWLPVDFQPCNTDGEVAGFELWPLDRVAETVRETDDFKFNCALVQIDLLVRHGFIGPDDPDYQAIVAHLHGARP